MKIVVIIYNKDDWNLTIPFQDHREYRSGYEKFYTMAEKEGIKFVRAFIGWYKGKGVFSKVWGFDIKKKKWVKLRDIKVDYAYDKISSLKEFLTLKRKIQKEIGMLNDINMSYKFNNKYTVYKIFKNLMPKTFLIKNQQELKNNINKIKTSKVVLKPVVGSGGIGIIIKEKEKLLSELKKIEFDEDYIIQEFVDTSNGIPNLIKGVHDLRVIVTNGKISYCYIRTPEKGKLLCNINQGGTVHNIKNSQIPKSVLKIIKNVDNVLKKYYPRIYTVDLFFSKDIPYIIEINTMPGMSYSKGEEKMIEGLYLDIITSIKIGLKQRFQKD